MIDLIASNIDKTRNLKQHSPYLVCRFSFNLNYPYEARGYSFAYRTRGQSLIKGGGGPLIFNWRGTFWNLIYKSLIAQTKPKGAVLDKYLHCDSLGKFSNTKAENWRQSINTHTIWELSTKVEEDKEGQESESENLL